MEKEERINKEIDVLLIFPPLFGEIETINMGLLYIASLLIQAGFSTDVLYFSERDDKAAENLKLITAKIVGISVMTPTYKISKLIAQAVKRRSNKTKVVFGGPHPTVLPLESLENDEVDIVCIQEGEYTMVEIARALIKGEISLSAVKGIAYKDESDSPCINPSGGLLKNLDNLPLPARHLLNFEHSPSINISRGCPHHCSFCFPSMGNYYRCRSPEKVANEFIEVSEKYKGKKISIFDEGFTYNRKRTLSLCKLLTLKGFKGSFVFQTRADTLDEEILKAIKYAGGDGMQIGVESGNQKILNKIKKNVTLKQIEHAVTMALKNKIKVGLSFIIGLPFDNKDTINDTIEFALYLMGLGKKYKSKAAVVFSLCTPYPGTDIYNNPETYRIKILSKDWTLYDSRHLIFENENINANEIKSLYVKAINKVMEMRLK